jgi:hypothetical protein
MIGILGWMGREERMDERGADETFAYNLRGESGGKNF